jgi:type I restriction enzyme S subunit
VSPDYVVFQTDCTTLLPAYLDQVRRSRIWSRFVEPAGSGSVRVRIYFRDLAEMRIPLPSLPEQRRITDTLGALDREIAILEQLRHAYEAQKRGLMKRLLSAELSGRTSVAEPELAHA